VTARFEELERLTMTTPAHLERCWCVELGDEMSGVSFRLFGLRRVSTVTAIARYSNFAVGACLKYCDDRVVILLTMTRRAVVLVLASNRSGASKDRHSGKQDPGGKSDS
jgi:hypothetical protein